MLSNAFVLPKKMSKTKWALMNSNHYPQIDYSFKNNFDNNSNIATSTENIVDTTDVVLPSIFLSSQLSTLPRRQHWRQYASGNDITECQPFPPALQRQPTYPLFPVFLTDNSKVYSNVACVVSHFNYVCALNIKLKVFYNVIVLSQN